MADSLLTPNPSSLGCSAREYSSDIRKVLNEYQRYKISHLKPGPVKATFSGLLVNLQDSHTTDNIPQGAKTAYTLILRDETGEIIVRGPVASRRKRIHSSTIRSIFGSPKRTTSYFSTTKSQSGPLTSARRPRYGHPAVGSTLPPLQTRRMCSPKETVAVG